MTEKQKEKMLGWLFSLLTVAIVAVGTWAGAINTSVNETRSDLLLEKDRSKRVDKDFEVAEPLIRIIPIIRETQTEHREKLEKLHEGLDNAKEDYHVLDKKIIRLQKDIEYLKGVK